MAVPFSRPAYPGSRRRAQQAHPRSQQQTTQQQQQQNNRHPITRFLDGQGGIQLDQLSLTSRIAFYALYEAYRLLTDLTQSSQQRISVSANHNNNDSSSNSTNHTVLHQENVQRNQQQQRAPVVLPDIIESTQQQHVPHGVVEEDKCQSAPDLVQDIPHHNNDNDEPDFARPMPDFIPPGNTRNETCAPADHHHQYQFRDFEKFRLKSRRSISISSDYFSLDGLSQVDEEEEEENDLDLSKEDHQHQIHDHINNDNDHLDHDQYLIKGINWHNLGHQLTEIASAFEVTYAPVMNEQQRQMYQVYRELKLKTLAISRRDSSMIGLAKTICRQVLLSSIWILLKKIM